MPVRLPTVDAIVNTAVVISDFTTGYGSSPQPPLNFLRLPPL